MVTDTDEARRKRSEQARKAALARSPESRRTGALKGAAAKIKPILDKTPL